MNFTSAWAMIPGLGSPHGADENGHSGQPWSTTLRRYQTPPTASASASAASSGRAARRRLLRRSHADATSTVSDNGAAVVFVPIARPAATSAGARTTAWRLLTATAHSAPHETSHASAAGSRLAPTLCEAITAGVAGIAAPAAERSG